MADDLVDVLGDVVEGGRLGAVGFVVEVGGELLLAGDLSAARTVADALETKPSREARPNGRAMSRRLHAQIALCERTDTDAALAAAREAVTLHADGGPPAEYGRSLAVLASVRRRREEHDEAGAIERRARAVLEGAGFLARARRVGPPKRAVDGRDVLSTSQRAVVDVVMAGHTNRETAERLGVSVRTVENHLRAAYRTLGVSSRTELPSAL